VREEHPFAKFVRILGKGKTGTRSLDFDEAREAFGMVLRGEVEELQLGAFLMLLRVKEETPAELAGFVRACRDYLGDMPPLHADLDWSSYAGKRNQHPWYLLSALLLAGSGCRVFMHGTDSHTPGRVYARQVLSDLGVPAAPSLQEADRQLAANGFAFMSLEHLLPPLHAIMQLKPLLGLRSPVNTLVRMMNPGAARYSIQSVFHPNYASLHIGADIRLGQPQSLVFKGEGGEVEIKPNARTVCHLQRDGHHTTITWPRQLEGKPAPVIAPSAEALLAAWRGERGDAYGETAVVETAASALLLTERAATMEDARRLSASLWQARDRGRFG
jgi:anthranilate phosphoribosyltransferase